MPALDVATFASRMAAGAIPLDLRAPAHFAVSHIRGAVFLQFGRQDMGDRAELYLPRTQPYVLLVEPVALGFVAEKLLTTAGFEVQGFLQGGLQAWTNAGRPIANVPTMSVHDLHQRLDAGEALDLLDVREDFEYDWGHVGGAVNLPHGDVWPRAAEFDSTRAWYVLCNDQIRSCAAASMLARLGFAHVTLVLGGTAGWIEAGYPLVKAGQAEPLQFPI